MMRSLIWEGKIPEVRIGRLVRLDPADLDAFIERRKRNDLLDADPCVV